MPKVLECKNEFCEYYQGLTNDEKEKLAKQLDTSPAYLYQLSAGIRKPGKHFARLIHLVTGYGEEAFK